MITGRNSSKSITRLTNNYVNCHSKNWPRDLSSLHVILPLHHQLNALLIQEEILEIALVFIFKVVVNPWTCLTKRLKSKTFALLAVSQATSQQSALTRKKSSAWSFTECQRKNIVTRLKSLWA